MYKKICSAMRIKEGWINTFITPLISIFSQKKKKKNTLKKLKVFSIT